MSALRYLTETTRLWGRQADHDYLPDPALIAAANVAIALGLPLLLTGEAGCGKTDFAFAVARFQSGKDQAWDPDDPDDGLLDCYVRSDSKARDLLYHYDAVHRFGDAHHGQQLRAADPRHYIELRPLGRALAEAEVKRRRRVVLIDEIDKAPRDLPNDLLRELDQGRFEIKELNEAAPAAAPISSFGLPLARELGLRRPAETERPLVIITSNEERPLPDAFLRRCVFHHIRFPDADRLVKLLATRLGGGLEASAGAVATHAAARTFTALRSVDSLRKKPATAELITWFNAGTQGLLGPEFLSEIKRFAEVITEDRGRLTKPRGQPFWSALPGRGCLLKQRADWDLTEKL